MVTFLNGHNGSRNVKCAETLNVIYSLSLWSGDRQPLSQEQQLLTYEMQLEGNSNNHLMKCQGLGTNTSGETMKKKS